MAKSEPDLGQVVWADVVDPQGVAAGPHAIILLTSKAEHAAGKPLRGVVVSSQLHLASTETSVLMKWTRDGHPQTKFDRKCAAMCKWIVEIQERDIQRYGGRISGTDLVRVVECVKSNAANEPSA